jgi:hypothetical protein
MRYRPIDPRVENHVAVALDQRFRIDACPSCGGPRVYSKTKPLARCFACGDRTELNVVAQPSRKVKCDQCRKFFWSVVAYAICPACKAANKKKAAMDAKWGGGQAHVASLPVSLEKKPGSIGVPGARFRDPDATGADLEREPERWIRRCQCPAQ